MTETTEKTEITEEIETLEKKRKIDRRTAAGMIFLILTPILSFVLFETVTKNITKMSPEYIPLNILWFYIFYLIIFALSGSSRITIGIGTTLFYVISAADYFVVMFRSKPIMIWEVFELGTAMSVAGTYDFVVSKRMIAVAIFLIAYNIFMWHFCIRIRGKRKRAAIGGCCAAAAIAGVVYFYDVVIPNKWLEVNQWYVKECYEEKGFVLSSAILAKYFMMEPPEGYSNNKVEKIYDDMITLMDEKEEDEGIQPVNLICIMNESLSDLKVTGDFETNIPYFPYMDSLTENTVKGSLYVPVFGSLTSNSEFEFLSGDLMRLLPTNTIAYQLYVKQGTKTLVSTLKDQGYRAVAMHPYPAKNWNRDKCYDYMGFDVFYDKEFYSDSERLRDYVSDKGDYDKIIQLVEEKENPDDKLFVFNVTMQNHGGYGGEFDNFEEEVWLMGNLEGKYPKTDQYLSLMKKSDEAFQYLTEYFSEVDEPTMIVMFGDHQPSVEDEFYDELYGASTSTAGWEDRSKWYQTPYVIWTNYEMPELDEALTTENLGAVYLSSYVLELANLKMTPYNQFLLELAKQIPVVNLVGCYDTDMKFYPWGDAEDGGHPFSESLREYKMLVYNHSMDKKKKLELYTIRQ